MRNGTQEEQEAEICRSRNNKATSPVKQCEREVSLPLVHTKEEASMTSLCDELLFYILPSLVTPKHMV
jgi:hypothetical protein